MQIFDFIGERNVGTLFGIRDSRRYWRLNPLINSNKRMEINMKKKTIFILAVVLICALTVFVFTVMEIARLTACTGICR